MNNQFDFIINPHSGSGTGKNSIPEIIREFGLKNLLDFRIHFTEYAGHGEIIAQKLVSEDTKNIVAVGGDGTVNEIANALVNTNSKLGIIPIGSGNGLARHLGIPMRTSAALKVLVKGNSTKIDGIKIENRYSFNVSGMGFDSHVADKFKLSKRRGLKEYTAIAMKELIHYQNGNYIIEIDDKTIKTKAFLVSLANSSQFGNNVKIAPTASVQDGLIDLVLIKPFPIALSFSFLPLVLSGTIEMSPFVEIFQTKKVRIQHDQTMCQIDGESVECSSPFIAEIVPQCLQIICNHN